VIRLRFAASRAAVRDAVVAVDAALAAAHVAGELRAAAQITLAEACNNIVEHAYKGDDAPGAGAITLAVAAEAGGLRVTLRDRGAPMPGGAMPGRALPRIDPDNPQGLPEGGFGWPLLRAMTRALHLSRRGGQNILTFRLSAGVGRAAGDRNAM